MIKIQIKSTFGSILFEFEKENNTVKDTVEEAINCSADLSYANLSSANLSSANLRSADLSYANLRSADLSYADLSSANLSSANLRSADLSSANLSSADLSSANLRSADLSSANLSSFKNDLWEILLKSKNEISKLKEKILDGQIDGSVYEGECCCLLGTIAVIRDCNYKNLKGIAPSSSRPAEQWFSMFKKGMSPENNDKLKLTVDWIEEFEAYLNA